TMVNQGAFREDLFFRLAVLPLHVPPLRERLADLPLLLETFLGPRAKEITNEMMGTLMKMPWTGNVRELRNFAERVTAVGPERAIAMAPSADADVAIGSVPPGALLDDDNPTNPHAGGTPKADPSEDYVVEGGVGWFEA